MTVGTTAPPTTTGTSEGKNVFADAGRGICHRLKAAGATGKIGPNLDRARPSKARVVARVTNGKGAMPSFKDRLSADQIEAVAEFVSSAAGR